jgi:signal transduction histidine kinase
MKLQARFLILFTFLFGAVALLVALQHNFDLNRSQTVLESELKQRKAYFGKITSLDGQPLKSFSVDYSFWDDMVDFVKAPNLKFAHDNIETGMATYGADASWVYRLDGSRVYFKAAEGIDDTSALESLSFSSDFFKKLHGEHFAHFYIQTSEGLLEVRGASIHPSDDSDRQTPPQGYWIVARYWDGDYMTALSDLTQSRLKLGAASASYADQLNGHAVSFGQPLLGWDGKPQAVLTATSDVPIVNELSTLYIRQLFLLAAIAFATILLLLAAIWYLVLSPVRLITQSLKTSDPKILEPLLHTSTEFGSLAGTLKQFFAQELKIKETNFIKGKLVDLNQAKSEFLAIAAHELKSSVGNIHVFAENLADLMETKAPKAQLLSEVQRISRHARKANVLINDLYQASKGGKALVLKRSQFEFDEFIRSEIADAQYSVRQTIKLTGNTNSRLTSDRDRLSQVMTNLLRNASKYSPKATEIRVILKREGNRVLVEVQDDGIGIPEKEQGRIFERFFRSDEVTTSYPGLGLGLSICKEIVEALGGRIWFQSQVGHGSQFFFSLPIDMDDISAMPHV